MLDTSGELCEYTVSKADGSTVNFHHRDTSNVQTVCYGKFCLCPELIYHYNRGSGTRILKEK